MLLRVARPGFIPIEDARVAVSEAMPDGRHDFPMLAAHAAERAVTEAPRKPVDRLTIDANVQRQLESLAAERAAALSENVSVAILVADHQSGEILASVGSSGLFDERRDGFVDMTRAVRSPARR